MSTPISPEYTYGGQWFDDMGAAALAISQSPVVGVDVTTTPGLDRNEYNDIIHNLVQANYNPYS